MARQKRFNKKIKWPPFIEAFKENISHNLMTIVILLVFAGVAVMAGGAFLHGSSYFSLRAVEVKGLGESQAALYIGNELLKTYRLKNIFDIDLKAVARYLEARYPDAKNIVAMRKMPDKLAVYINFRRPVASLDSARRYFVDEEGVIFSNSDNKPVAGLPAISGISQRSDGKVKGQGEYGKLNIAMELLKEIKRSRFLRQYAVTKIDAGDIRNLSFFLNDGLEVKIGFENFKERLNVLKYTLKDPRLIRDQVEYIDLRFGDAVIGPK